MEVDREEEPEMAANALKVSALYAVRQGAVEDGLAIFEEAQSLDPDLFLWADDYDIICRYGSLWGFASEVLFACDEAVEEDTSYGYFRDSRGIARAMTGDFEGAIEDFQTFVDFEVFGPDVDMRLEWIEELEAGNNPFENQELLEELRNQ
jgi:tetratricopeptide (TPR) repeat protein